MIIFLEKADTTVGLLKLVYPTHCLISAVFLWPKFGDIAIEINRLCITCDPHRTIDFSLTIFSPFKESLNIKMRKKVN